MVLFAHTRAALELLVIIVGLSFCPALFELVGSYTALKYGVFAVVGHFAVNKYLCCNARKHSNYLSSEMLSFPFALQIFPVSVIVKLKVFVL